MLLFKNVFTVSSEIREVPTSVNPYSKHMSWWLLRIHNNNKIKNVDKSMQN